MSAEHALDGWIEKVDQAWNAGDVASLLLLDVSGAFDHVSHVRFTAQSPETPKSTGKPLDG